MVKLSISPATVRTFPYTGYLGLTPLKVEGCVCASLFPDEKPMLARSITISVRCYESRFGRVSALQTNVLVDHTEELWSKPDAQEYAEITDLELPFRIILPPDLGGRSTMSFPDYRVFWRIEAVIYHIPIVGVGSRQVKHYTLPWVRYGLPRLPRLPTPLLIQLDSQTTKSRAPVIRYSVETPHNPVGPLDLVSVTIRLLPVDSSVSIRSASMIVERRIHFLDSSTPPSPCGSTPPPLLPSESGLTLCDPETPGTAGGSVSRSTSRPPSPILSPVNDKGVDFHSPYAPHSTPLYSESCFKVSTAVLAHVESSGRFAQDHDGIWIKTLTFQWPAAKSSSRWSIGETSQTDMVSVKFFARIRIIISSSSGTESIELSEEELTAIATNAAERELAACKHKGMQDSTSSTGKARSKSKSKSPRRRKRQHTHDPMPVGSICSESTIRVDTNSMTPHASPGPSNSKRSPSRRPHTSDGSSDKAHSFDYVVPCAFDGEQRSHEKPSRKRSADVANVDSMHSTEAGPSRILDTESPRRGRSIRGLPRNSTDTAVCSTESARMEEIVDTGTTSSTTPSDHVRAWEEELVRVEGQSRRRSAEMWGFAHKLKQMMGDRFAARAPIPAHNER